MLFKDDELRSRLSVVVGAEWFLRCLCMVRAQVMESPGLTPEAQRGALLYESALLGMTTPEDDRWHALNPGLHHSLPGRGESAPGGAGGAGGAGGS